MLKAETARTRLDRIKDRFYGHGDEVECFEALVKLTDALIKEKEHALQS